MSQGTPRPEHELLPGDVCDGYRIVSLIAAGGMGDVYEAMHDPTGRKVAVKCLKVRHRNKEDARARMKMEAVVLSELQHENLVQVYDAGVTDAGMVWFAMERLHGQTLRDVLYRAGRLPIADALHYGSEIADGVDAVHEVNVIHRDLKPENVFVTRDNVVKVLDLGTGKFTGYGLNSTDRMRVIGTTAYMSPEQIKGLRVDARADVYALGLIVYEMIAGRHALAPEGATLLPQGIEQVALMQLQMTPKPLADVAYGCPRYVSSIVDKAIAKERDRRFPTIAAMARELRAARKRLLAENQFDGTGVPGGGEGLREKFGAPPRSTPAPRLRISAPPRPAISPEPVGSAATAVAMGTALVPDGAEPSSLQASAPDTAADVVAKANDFPTDIQPAPIFTLDGSTPAPGYVPTVLLSSSSVPGMPPELHGQSDATDRALPPDEVRNRTTQTNPIGFVRAAADPNDDSLEIDFVGGSRFAFWRHPFVRRAAVTLGLGAIIGVPPAVLGVVWARYQRAPASAPSAVARAVATSATRAPLAVAPPTSVAPPPLSEARAEVAATTRASHETVKPGAASGGKTAPRARPKSPLSATTTAMPTDGLRPSELKQVAPPPAVDPPPKTILPPSGL